MSCWVLVSGKGWRNSTEEFGNMQKKKKKNQEKQKYKVNFFFLLELV